jgi:hypothetical protein
VLCGEAARKGGSCLRDICLAPDKIFRFDCRTPNPNPLAKPTGQGMGVPIYQMQTSMRRKIKKERFDITYVSLIIVRKWGSFVGVKCKNKHTGAIGREMKRKNRGYCIIIDFGEEKKMKAKDIIILTAILFMVCDIFNPTSNQNQIVRDLIPLDEGNT